MPIRVFEKFHYWLDRAAKRLLDIVVALAMLLIMAPILMIVALAIRVTSRGPLVYTQKRVGRDGVMFAIYKFRTMCVGADLLGPSVTSSDDNRITPIGKFLRTSKLDEFPQLINVLIGDMSLVGPRPQVPRFVDLFDPEMREIVLSVRPGVTGLTAICFRNEEQILANVGDRERYYVDRILPVKLELDAWYVQNRSVFKDAYIFFATAWLLMVGFSRSMFKQAQVDKDQELVKCIVTRYLALSAPPSSGDRFHPARLNQANGMFFLRDEDMVASEAA